MPFGVEADGYPKFEGTPEKDSSIDDIAQQIIEMVWQPPVPQPPTAGSENVDHILEYSSGLLADGLQLECLRSAIRANNGDIMILMWKFHLMAFHRKHHWKYLYAGVDLLAGSLVICNIKNRLLQQHTLGIFEIIKTMNIGLSVKFIFFKNQIM